MFGRSRHALIAVVAVLCGLGGADGQTLSVPALARVEQTPRPLMAQAVARRQREPERIIASFSQRDRWSYTGGIGEGQVVLLADGRARLKVYVVSSSGAFKYFAEPHVALIVTDDKGQVIQNAGVSGLAMRMGLSGVFEKEDRSYADIPPGRLRDVAYAFFAFKYCGWQQTFERTVGTTNGCAKSHLRREYDVFVKQLPDALASLDVNAGDRFKLHGWLGARIKWNSE